MSFTPDDIQTPESPSNRRTWSRRILLLAIGVLYLASVPWYREATPEGHLEIIGGLPDWVAVALGCYVGVAILNCFAWLLTDVPDHLDPSDSPPRTSSQPEARR